MIKYMIHFIYAVILLAALISELKSQDNRGNHPWWVDIGAGPAMINSNLSMNVAMVYCYQLDRTIISARIIGITNKNPTIQKYDPSNTTYKITDYGILYGPILHFEDSYFSISGGIGLIRASYEKSSGTTLSTSISIPAELQWFWRPTYFAGIGLYVYTALNNREQLSGAMICVQLGVW